MDMEEGTRALEGVTQGKWAWSRQAEMNEAPIGAYESTAPIRKGPVRVFRSGSISASVWRSDKRGRGRSAYGVRIQKRLLLQDVGWRNVQTMHFGDLPHLIAVTREAYLYLEAKLRPRDVAQSPVVKDTPMEGGEEGPEDDSADSEAFTEGDAE